jgi:hypothetical protein
LSSLDVGVELAALVDAGASTHVYVVFYLFLGER